MRSSTFASVLLAAGAAATPHGRRQAPVLDTHGKPIVAPPVHPDPNAPVATVAPPPVTQIHPVPALPTGVPVAPPGAPIQGPGIPVGNIITKCTVPGTFALTYDDGPFDFTSHVLDLLDQANIKVSRRRDTSSQVNTNTPRPPSSSTATT